ncbi:MAG: T9SS type A sorting domain-containing protein [Taibaiella sp.]|nr:T9SS type A sorting domain-containing protein [Taibaiella sp.]
MKQILPYDPQKVLNPESFRNFFSLPYHMQQKKSFKAFPKLRQHLYGALLTLAGTLLLSTTAVAATFTVTNTGDNGGTNPAANAGTGTLRQAIVDANASAGTDIITFNIAGGVSVKTIVLSAFLPIIADPVSIQGYSQPGAAQGPIGSRTIMIQINCNDVTSLPADRTGFGDGIIRFNNNADGSSLSGISIYNTSESTPVQIQQQAGNVHIWGNYIGVLASGASPASADYVTNDNILIGNYQGTGAAVITNVTIGTNGDGNNDANEGNVISRASHATNGGSGIQVGVSGHSYTYSNLRISGNYIGIEADGITAAPNGILTTGTVPIAGNSGITLVAPFNSTAAMSFVGTNGDGTSDDLERNVISGNFGNGLDITDANSITVAGNYIGTDKNGIAALPNGLSSATSGLAFSGILVINSSNIIIGFNDATMAAAVAANARNIISGNTTDGVTYLNCSGTGNKVSGNYIGTTVTGLAPLPNGSSTVDPATGNRTNAVEISGSSNVLIGTDADGDDDVSERNVLAATTNGYGLNIRNTSPNNIVAGNYIGVGADGTTALGNARGGIAIKDNGSSNNRIGSNDDGTNDAIEANIIANNGTNSGTALFRSGITVLNNTTGNRFSRNVYYSNKGLPIDLSDNAVTLNDGSTTNNNPNLLLDYPVITSHSLSGSTMTVSGYVSTCNGSEPVAGGSIAGTKIIQFYKMADDGDQNGALTNGSCTRSVAHGEGVQYLGSITGVTNTFTNQTFSLVSGATFGAGDRLTAITIDASGNTSEFGVLAILSISGNVFNDANGLNDLPTAIINGTGTNAGGLNAILYDNTTGQVVGVSTVSAGGTYSFDNVVSGNNYTLYITTATATVGQTAVPAVTLPAGWVSTGEQNCVATAGCTGSDGTPNGILPLNNVSRNITQANFGIERVPDTQNKTQTIAYPTGGIIPQGEVSTDGTGTDPEDGVLTGSTGSLAITQLPANATMLYNGNPVTVNMIINNFDPSLLSFTGITAGSVSVEFSYAMLDAAGVQDPTPATFTLNWSTPLPISLKSFIAYKNNNVVDLVWITAGEYNNKGFAIERSSNSRNWTTIGFVSSKFVNGNSNQGADYIYTDHSPVAGRSFYRLQQIDHEGQVNYSQISTIDFASTTKVNIHPNPVASLLIIDGLAVNNTYIRVINVTGSKVKEMYTNGKSSLQIDLSELSSGQYFIEISDDQGKVIKHKVIKL